VQSSRLAASSDDAHRASLVAAIEHQVKRMQQMLRETGQPAGSRAPGPPQTPPTPPRGITAPAPPPRPAQMPAPPLPFPSPARPAAAAQPALARASAAVAPGPASGPAGGASGLDGLVAEMVQFSRPALAARPVSVEIRMTPGTPLPRCSPIGLKRSFAALFQGLSAVVAPQSAIVLRAEKKPVLFKGKDGSQQTR